MAATKCGISILVIFSVTINVLGRPIRTETKVKLQLADRHQVTTAPPAREYNRVDEVGHVAVSIKDVYSTLREFSDLRKRNHHLRPPSASKTELDNNLLLSLLAMRLGFDKNAMIDLYRLFFRITLESDRYFASTHSRVRGGEFQRKQPNHLSQSSSIKDLVHENSSVDLPPRRSSYPGPDSSNSFQNALTASSSRGPVQQDVFQDPISPTSGTIPPSVRSSVNGLLHSYSPSPLSQNSSGNPILQNSSSELLQQSFSLELFQQSSSLEPPKQNSSLEPFQQSSSLEPFQQNSSSGPLQQSSSSGPLQQSSSSGPLQQSSSSGPLQQSSSSGPFQQSSSSGPLQQSSSSGPLQQSSSSGLLQQSSSSGPLQQNSSSGPLQQSSSSGPLQQSSFTEPLQQSSFTEPLQQSSFTEPLQQSSFTEPLQQSPYPESLSHAPHPASSPLDPPSTEDPLAGSSTRSLNSAPQTSHVQRPSTKSSPDPFPGGSNSPAPYSPNSSPSKVFPHSSFQNPYTSSSPSIDSTSLNDPPYDQPADDNDGVGNIHVLIFFLTVFILCILLTISLRLNWIYACKKNRPREVKTREERELAPQQAVPLLQEDDSESEAASSS